MLLSFLITILLHKESCYNIGDFMLQKIQIQAVHYELSETSLTFIQEKLTKLDYLKTLITNGVFRIVRDNETYKIEADINLHHKKHIHIETNNDQLYPAIENCIHSLRHKLSEIHKQEKSHHKAHSSSVHHRDGHPTPLDDDDNDNDNE